jgi:hypothetical protein
MSFFLKNLPVKVLGGRFLSVRGPLLCYDPILPPPLHTVYVCTLQFIHTGKGGEWES